MKYIFRDADGEVYGVLAPNAEEARERANTVGLANAVLIRHAFVAIVAPEGKFAIGRADEGIRGYSPQPELGEFDSYTQAFDKAQEYNEAMGLSDDEAALIICSTMRQG